MNKVEHVGAALGLVGGACIIASPLLPWIAGIEHAPDGPGAFHFNGFGRFSRQAWIGGGRTLLALGVVCVLGALVCLARHPVVGASLVGLGGLGAGLVAVADKGNVTAMTAIWVPGLDSYDVTMKFAPGLPALFIGAAVALVSALIIIVARLVLRDDTKAPLEDAQRESG